MTSLTEPVQNLSLAEKVCLPPHLAAFYVCYEKPKSGKVEKEIVYAASETKAKDAVKGNCEIIKPVALSYSW